MKQNQTGNRQTGSGKRGFVLITSYLILSVLSIFSVALYSYHLTFFDAAERNKNKVVAFNAAEAGFDDAFVRLKNESIASFPWQSGYISIDTGNIQGGYRVTITDMGNNIKKVSAFGYAPGESTGLRAQEVRPIIAYAGPDSLFSYAIFGLDEIKLEDNAFTDSYNSDVATYDFATAGAKGKIGTNSTEADHIELEDNVIVNGKAVVGPGGNPATVIKLEGNAAITGAQEVAASLRNCTPPVVPPDAVSLGEIKLENNDTLTLPAGTYHADKLKIEDNGQLILTGPVSLYVDDEVEIEGNGVVTSGTPFPKPPNFLLFGLGSGEIEIEGNTNFYGGIYAPNSEIEVEGNAQIFGAVIANEFKGEDGIPGAGTVHFDEALKNVAANASCGGFKLRSWQETGTTAGG